jgi:hypothetical protein
VDCSSVTEAEIARIRRTYESSRLVELAAIAVTGLSLYHGGGHEMMDVAVRGSGADYLVDAESHRLEIAGRSRCGDLDPAWQQRVQRLVERTSHGFYISVVEFETPAGSGLAAPKGGQGAAFMYRDVVVESDRIQGKISRE